MRGLPGSGKSTHIQQHYPNHYVCSADLFFEGLADSQGTTYRDVFDPRLLPQAHASCLREFILMLDGVNDLVVDNTCSQKWEYENYILLASLAGYDVVIIEMPCRGFLDVKRYNERGIHGVPMFAMEAMFERWEHDARAIGP
jgi:predicted kinase